MISLTVELGERSYPIYIAECLIDTIDFSSLINGKQVMIITNTLVKGLYLDSLVQNLNRCGFEPDTLILPDGEKYKNLDTLNKIFDALIESKHNRSTSLIALGGGVIGDMTGFAAACYQRGVDFIQIPTTLLSQVDSSVGGKTAVNHPSGKNMIGAFYQPKAVIIDTKTLQSLPDREYRAGLAEVIKYGLIADCKFFEFLERNVDSILSKNSSMLAECIKISCATKAKIVSEDEREQGIRAILNLGHTFGHAIEAAQQYIEWLHGEAVAAGILMAAELSTLMGDLSEKECSRIQNIFVKTGLPIHPPRNVGAEKFLQLMGLDKKVSDSGLRLVLLKSIGEAHVTNQFPLDELQNILARSQN